MQVAEMVHTDKDAPFDEWHQVQSNVWCQEGAL